MTDFENFLKTRETASTAFVDGDPDPLLALSVTEDPATIFPPTGAVIDGAAAVNEGNQAGAANFTPDADNHFEIHHFGADKSLAYWTGVQRSRVRMRDGNEPVQMDLRITEIFRRIDGQWKLFHRHADRLSDQ